MRAQHGLVGNLIGKTPQVHRPRVLTESLLVLDGELAVSVTSRVVDKELLDSLPLLRTDRGSFEEVLFAKLGTLTA
ncbi:hypothetical protein DLINEEME_00245 [Klebsiella phage 066042]|uniref:Uncharacterized protein n=1 Tax=Klebsiella phage 066042 TaxID=2777399 RepID=A0A7S6TY27_9CAUD|nr:hypothetical protein DLINEEME_00245 [Klebsiella phage 066042]